MTSTHPDSALASLFAAQILAPFSVSDHAFSCQQGYQVAAVGMVLISGGIMLLGLGTRQGRRRLYQHRRILIFIVLACVFEILFHIRSFHIPRPRTPLDPPFAGGCQNQYDAARDSSRENAAIVMLARNEDLDGAVTAIRSIERQFNRQFNYPVVFLNDMPWDPRFIRALRQEVSGNVTFQQIPAHMWGWPTWMGERKRDAARRSMQEMEARGLPYAGEESYHHMCRFESGYFFDHPALQPYDWYWRVEPDVEFTCAITYDPFALMAANNKTYGYTMALWEVGSTSPSLFRTVSDYKEERGLPTTSLWTAMMDASWAPWPIRNLVIPHLPDAFHSRTATGDAWNFCHFWSNFEIADLRFFRARQYREFFAHLDATGGFYHERWGDAPVHSLALALFSQPENLHYFEDIGYRHPPFQHCPQNAPKGVGCRCDCDPHKGHVPDVCLRRLRQAVDPA